MQLNSSQHLCCCWRSCGNLCSLQRNRQPMSKSSSSQLLHFDFGSQQLLLQLLFPLQPLSLLLQVQGKLPVVGQHQFVLLLGQVEWAEPVRLLVGVDVVGVEVVAQRHRGGGERNVDRGRRGRDGRLVVVDAAWVLLHLPLLASLRLRLSVRGEHGEIWRGFDIFLGVQLDHLVRDIGNSCLVILESSQRGAAASVFQGGAVLVVY